jgi:hypothetical protein
MYVLQGEMSTTCHAGEDRLIRVCISSIFCKSHICSYLHAGRSYELVYVTMAAEDYL